MLGLGAADAGGGQDIAQAQAGPFGGADGFYVPGQLVVDGFVADQLLAPVARALQVAVSVRRSKLFLSSSRLSESSRDTRPCTPRR